MMVSTSSGRAPSGMLDVQVRLTRCSQDIAGLEDKGSILF
jgi:hypothetical protein